MAFDLTFRVAGKDAVIHGNPFVIEIRKYQVFCVNCG